MRTLPWCGGNIDINNGIAMTGVCVDVVDEMTRTHRRWRRRRRLHGNGWRRFPRSFPARRVLHVHCYGNRSKSKLFSCETCVHIPPRVLCSIVQESYIEPVGDPFDFSSKKSRPAATECNILLYYFHHVIILHLVIIITRFRRPKSQKINNCQ